MTLTPAQRLRLGTFLLVGFGLCVVAVGWLAGMRVLSPRQIYRARFHESVSGLEPSAPVKYQGLQVGRVEKMVIAADDPRAIEVTLALARDVQIREGTLAILDVSGLTGLKTINLTAGDPRRPRLPPGSVLRTGPSLLDRLSDNAASIVGDVKRITDQLAQMVTPANRERLESLLGNLDRLVDHVDAAMVSGREPIEQLIGEVQRTTSAIGETAHEATRTLHTVRLAVDGTQQAVLQTLAAVERPLREVDPHEVARTVVAVRGAADRLGERLGAAETGRAVAGFADTMRRLDHLVEDVDLAVRSGREDFVAGLSYVRQAAEELREFSRMLAQNPSVLVRGRGDSE